MKLKREQIAEILRGGKDIRLSQEQIAEAITALLPKIAERGGRLQQALFEASFVLAPRPSVEAVALRIGVGDSLEVYLSRRGSAVAHAREYHCPGTYLLSGDTVESALWRLSTSESMGSFPCHVAIAGKVCREELGSYFAYIVLVKAPEALESETAGWYPVHDLPRPMVPHHEKVIIPAALDYIRLTDAVLGHYVVNADARKAGDSDEEGGPKQHLFI